MTHSHSAHHITEQAAAWFSKLQADSLTELELQQFEAWLSSNRRHAREFEQFSQLWSDFDGLSDWAGKELEQSRRLTAQTLIRKIGQPLLSPLLLVMFILLGTGGYYWLPGTLAVLASDYHTATGELRTLTLADGSTVLLDSQSALSVDYSQHTRKLTLHKGRASFSVTHDPNRPFIVESASGKSRALGTKFEVDKAPEQVSVTVIESRVEVSYHRAIKQLGRGQQVSYDSETGLSKIKTVDLHALTAWQRGKLIFHDKPLAEVVDTLNRYHPGTIMLVDQSLRTMPVSGIFNIDKPESVLQALQEILPINSYQLGGYLTLLTRSDTSL